MEGEMNNFAMVWFTVFASLCYIHTTSKFIPKGTIRFLTILPISILFILLPLNLTTIHLGATSSFFVAWLANFKILLFAFGKGPLSSDPPIPLSLFIPLACLPIKIHHSNIGFKETPSHESNKKPSQSYKSYVIKLLLLCVLIKTYDYKEHLNPNFVLFLYCFHIYFSLELILAMFATLARVLMQAELEPQFDEPYLTTSLQDFWGKRWNLMVSNILKPTVFEPTRYVFSGLVGRKLATYPGVFATFFVSGLMHELVFYNYGRQKTRWEVMFFFVLHGVSLGIEMALKKLIKFRLPPMVSRTLTIMYVVVTSFWLFFPPFLRGHADVKGCTELLAFIEFVWSGRLVSPNDLSCPYL